MTERKPPIENGFKSARRLWEEAVSGSPADPSSPYAQPIWSGGTPGTPVDKQPTALDVPKCE